MKVFNKLLIASTMVVTLGATISCGNNKQSKVIKGGVPYTYFALTSLSGSDQYTVGFKYEGSKDIKVYWGIESTTPSQETSHTFKINNSKSYSPIVKIEGDVSSIWFADENGKSIEKDNDQITTILFSNTITSIPKYACSSLSRLKTVFIPNSVTKVGEYAFLAPIFQYAFCAWNSCPKGWDKNWGTIQLVDEFITWGVNYQILEDDFVYLTYTLNDVNEAYYCGPLYTEEKSLTIPSEITIEGTKFKVTAIVGVGFFTDLETIEIPNNIKYIGYGAFAGCTNLKTVTFKGQFDKLAFGEEVFAKCTSLTEFVIPEGTITLSRGLFEGCNQLTKITIPSSVKWIEDETFCYCGDGNELNVNVTSYTDPIKIARCQYSPFDYASVDKVIFTYSEGVSVDAFKNKGWPVGEQDFGPQVEWTLQTI